MPRRFILTLTEGDGSCREQRLAPGSYVIGREPDCDIVVASADVSRHHARITLGEVDLLIEDLGSSTGTLVQNLRVSSKPQPWPYPQSLSFGSVTLDVRPLDAPDEVSPATLGADPDSLIPFVFGREIARGGMGSIIEADDRKLGRKIAVKVMLLEADADDAQKQRFVQEAAVLGRLEHPNIVPIHDLGRDSQGQLYYTMKLVKGRTLQAILNDLRDERPDGVERYTLDRLLTVFRKVCDAVAFAHSQGIIHRDLKPENVMVGEFGEVLVMDWGLAKILKDEGGRMKDEKNSESGISNEASSSFSLPPSSLTATLQGAVMGTPQYMSPEQAEGRIADMDARSDIFSLGGILYSVLTLRPPVEGKTLDEVLRKVASGSISPPSLFGAPEGNGKPIAKNEVLEPRKFTPLPHCPGGRVPSGLSSVVMKALRLDMGQRYQAVSALSADIEAYQGGFATSAERAGLGKQLVLLIKRNKGVFGTATAAWLLITALAVWFVINLRASERVAKANERSATQQAEQTRRTLAKSQVAVAEAAFRSVDLPAMVQALDSVPDDLRDQRWDYLSVKRDASLGDFRVRGFPRVSAVAAVPGNPCQFAIINPNGNVAIVDVKTGAKLMGVSTSFKSGATLAISADGLHLAVTGKGAPDIRILGVANGRREKVVPAPGGDAKKLVFSPDGNSLAVLDGFADKATLSLVDLRDGSVRWRQPGFFFNAIFSPDGSRLFLGNSQFRKFMIVGVEKGDVISRMDAYVYSMAMSRDGRRLALGLHGGEVVLIDVATGTETRRARLQLGGISRLAWTAADHLLTLGGEGGFENGRRVLRLWETANFSARGTFFGMKEGGPEDDWDFNPESGHLLTTGNPPHLWRIPVDAEAARITSKAEQGWSVCFLSDDVLFARKEFALARYDVTKPRIPKELPSPGNGGYTMAAPHWPGGMFALASRLNRPPHSIKIFAGTSGDLTERREIPMEDWTMRLDFDAPGERIIAVTPNHGTLVLDVRSGETLLKVPARLERAVFTGTGAHFAAIVPKKREADDVEDELVLFDAKTGQRIKSVLHRLRLNELVVSPDRRLIAIGGGEQVVHVLDADTLEERFNFRAHDAEITAIAFHPKLPVIATASADGSAKLWDYETARLRETFLGFDGMPVMVAFSPNGRLLAVESQEHTARLFDLSGESAPASVARPVVNIPPDADGWQDLLGALNGADVINEGNGWRLDDGVLSSPSRPLATLPLPGDLAGTSYVLRVKLRQLAPKEVFHVILPVGNQMVGFDLDGSPFAGFYTSLVMVNGKWGKTLPGSLSGKQVRDSEPHVLEVTVSLEGTNARINTSLDARPLYKWNGPSNTLSAYSAWNVTPGVISLGAMAADWQVHEVKVKRLEKK